MVVGLNTQAENAGVNGMAGSMAYLSLHTAEPDASGSNESAAGRQPAGWSTASGGTVSVSSLTFTGGADSGPCTHVGFWSAATGGTYFGCAAIPGSSDQSFNSAGEIEVSGTLTAQ